MLDASDARNWILHVCQAAARRNAADEAAGGGECVLDRRVGGRYEVLVAGWDQR